MYIYSIHKFICIYFQMSRTRDNMRVHIGRHHHDPMKDGPSDAVAGPSDAVAGPSDAVAGPSDAVAGPSGVSGNVEKIKFDCKECSLQFKTHHGLRIHTGRKHKD